MLRVHLSCTEAVQKLNFKSYMIILKWDYLKYTKVHQQTTAYVFSYALHLIQIEIHCTTNALHSYLKCTSNIQL